MKCNSNTSFYANGDKLAVFTALYKMYFADENAFTPPTPSGTKTKNGSSREAGLCRRYTGAIRLRCL